MDSTLEQDIRKGQLEDEKIKEIRELMKVGKAPDFTKDAQGTIWFKKRICVPDIESIRETILLKPMIQLILFIQEVLRCIKI